MPGRLISDTRSAFGYRDWLAHGRNWVPKLGRHYDFASVYNLARDVESASLLNIRRTEFLRIAGFLPTRNE